MLNKLQHAKYAVGIAQKGRSMIEMLGVLAIIGVLSVGGIFGYQKAMARHRLNITIQQVTEIVSNMRTVFGSRGINNPYRDFGPDKTLSTGGMQLAIQLGVFPSEMFGDEETVPIYMPEQVEVRTGVYSYRDVYKGDAEMPTVKNIYRGDVYIITEDDGETFSVIFENLPKEAAIAISTLDLSGGDSSNIEEVLLVNEDEE